MIRAAIGMAVGMTVMAMPMFITATAADRRSGGGEAENWMYGRTEDYASPSGAGVPEHLQTPVLPAELPVSFSDVQVTQGTEADLVRTYRSTIRPLYAYVSRRVGGDAALAEDLVQDFYFAGRSVREIARAPQISERAVEGRLRRAREKLRKQIERIRPRSTRRSGEAEGETTHVQPTRTP